MILHRVCNHICLILRYLELRPLPVYMLNTAPPTGRPGVPQATTNPGLGGLSEPEVVPSEDAKVALRHLGRLTGDGWNSG